MRFATGLLAILLTSARGLSLPRAPRLTLGSNRIVKILLSEVEPCDVDSHSGVNPRATAVGVEPLKVELRLTAARVNRGFTASANKSDRLQLLTAELESANTEIAPTSSEQLPGKWRLDFTDAADVLSLGVLPVAEIGDIWQNISPSKEPGEFNAQNVVELLPIGSALFATLGLRSAVEYTVDATCSVQSPMRLGLVFNGVRAKPVLPSSLQISLPPLSAALPRQLVERLQELTADRVFLETTYLDGDLRVARGPSRELYVLSKVDES
eukprot:CAMPEP_0183355246 /NCGR_PEP_ID=MMETSP0164_2-20130417/39595_1 /TAXON_ID=221442 /ORGANISM="Coccolithus pelagicus ssp braarudi, Strain PLY182g" /LENGTH=267 /DNA_ID=CAMNT_0025528289 /DNA_START=7 /DNA_END=810 /DNA_ORIENTATION=+